MSPQAANCASAWPANASDSCSGAGQDVDVQGGDVVVQKAVDFADTGKGRLVGFLHDGRKPRSQRKPEQLEGDGALRIWPIGAVPVADHAVPEVAINP